MKPLRFYEHFACAYGTIWLLTLVVSFATQSHINAGAFGVFGFPVIALIYAFIRYAASRNDTQEINTLRTRISDLESRINNLQNK